MKSIFKALCCLAALLPLIANAKDIQLRDGWLLNGTYPATVPSTVMGVLTANGEYPHILEGMAYQQIDKSRFDASFTYSKTFELDAEDLKGHIFLDLDGINYRANIRLNGQLIADKETVYGTYRRHHLNITQVAKATNTLEIELFRAQKGDPNAGYVDWNPRPADESMGVFRPVTIHTCGDVLIRNIGVSSQVNVATLKEAWLQLAVDVENLSQQPVQGMLVGTLEGKEFQFPVQLQAGQKKTLHLTSDQIAAFHVQNPRLWWCRQMGSPDLYEMKLAFKTKDNIVSDSATTSFGIREVKSYFTRDGFQGFTLNGKPVLIRGGGWTDDIFMRDTEERYKTQLEYVYDMNLNAIRMETIWGTSQYIFDQCDKMGILVLPGWSCQWEWDEYLGKKCIDMYGGITTPEDKKLVSQYFQDQILWLRNHPSIICWFVGSDMLPMPDLELTYNEILRQFDPTRPLVTSAKKMTSEVSGCSGMKMEGPYNYVAPAYWYNPKAPGGAIGFNTETCIGAQLPQKESLIKMLGKNPWPISEVWDYHCTASNTNMGKVEVLQDVITGRYGEATHLDDFLKKADLVNYEATRAMFEAFRANEPYSTGIIQWMLNPARPGLYWQLYDHYLVPNAAYYSVKKGNEANQLIYDYQGNILGVNSRQEKAQGTATIKLYNLQGELIHSESKSVQLTPRKPVKIFKVPSIQSNAMMFLEFTDENGKLTRNDYVLTDQPDEFDWEKSDWIMTPMKRHGNFKALTSMQQVNPVITTQMKDNQLVITLENTANQVAFFIRLALKDKNGELITPAFYSDNYLSIEPGATRMVTCQLTGSQLPKGAHLVVEGWNTKMKNIAIK